MKAVVLLVWVVCLAGFVKSQNSFQTDAASNSVRIEFDFVETSDWSNQVITKFKQIISTFSSKYCNINTTACGLPTKSQFKPSDVIISSLLPQHEDIIVIVYVRIPNNANINGNYVVRKQALQNIIVFNKNKISSSLRDETNILNLNSFRISRVNELFVLKLADQTLNKILIPITCVLFVAMVAVVAMCEMNSSKQNKEMLEECQKQATIRKNGTSPDPVLFQVQNQPSEVV